MLTDGYPCTETFDSVKASSSNLSDKRRLGSSKTVERKVSNSKGK